ncbi:hypothetical protein POVWA2_079170 [Plasmodium ovale wallikeri]|uniref:Uncharacterized protein n=2 Tax=Plasmodium ovale TaxID=36330 RepID=A0A1A9ALQ6_PLAOA|nr:hypothetical protein POVWA2_079170 [Plasmodium ovale wallikeri]SBT57578.1 hypothetical protein POVWA1_082420 [Plasmodium ovale wallikeri]SBT72155.1 hypothetical protein POWCR01_000012400 [Plasmodium ovale]
MKVFEKEVPGKRKNIPRIHIDMFEGNKKEKRLESSELFLGTHMDNLKTKNNIGGTLCNVKNIYKNTLQNE